MTHILVFGTSIEYGAWDSQGGWVDRLKQFMHQKHLEDQNFYCIVYNCGVSGDITDWLLDRFDIEARSRISKNEENIIIFSTIGSNDCEFINKSKEPLIKPERFRENLIKLISKARKFADKIIFVESPTIDESKVDPIPWLPERAYKLDLIEKYNKILRDVCKKEKIHFIPTFELLNKEDLDDGVHPNTEGHKKIFEVVKDFLIEKRVI